MEKEKGDGWRNRRGECEAKKYAEAFSLPLLNRRRGRRFFFSNRIFSQKSSTKRSYKKKNKSFVQISFSQTNFSIQTET